MKRFVFFLGNLLAFFCQVQAQTLTYYKDSRGIYTASEVDSMVAAMDARIKAKGFDLTSVKEITGEFKSGDTLFYTFRLKGVNMELIKKNEAKRNSIIGKPLPYFAFTDIDGKSISSKDLKGKAVVLNLWFTTCAPCIIEMPDLNKIQKENPDMLFIAMTFEEKDKVKNFLEKTVFTFRQVTDVKEYVEKLEFGYPTTLFIDRNGVVQEIIHGASLKGLDHESFLKALQKIKP